MNRNPQPFTVTQLNHQVKQSLEARFGSVAVIGEITDIARPRSGHIYLTLKDSQCQVRGVIWNRTAEDLPFELCDGQKVVCSGSVDVYPPRGSYQLVIRQIELQGAGGLQLALRQLQEKLSAEGLFAPERKKPLPQFPTRVGILTSPTGAAVRDFLQVTRRRWPGIEIIVIPSNVQGAEAAHEIVLALVAAHGIDPPLDVLVVGRGGGSIEDLWCFNDERVVRAIAAAEIPIISAIGHEIDITLSDLASDRRALTPSEAGELVVASKSNTQAELSEAMARMYRGASRFPTMRREMLQSIASRPAFTKPFMPIIRLDEQLSEMHRRLVDLPLACSRNHRHQVNSSFEMLNAVSPLNILDRGYAIVQRGDQASVVRAATDLASGDEVTIRFSDGRASATVNRVKPQEEET